MTMNTLISGRFNFTITYCKKIYILVGICVSQSKKFLTKFCTVVTTFCAVVEDVCAVVMQSCLGIIALKLTYHSRVSFLFRCLLRYQVR